MLKELPPLVTVRLTRCYQHLQSIRSDLHKMGPRDHSPEVTRPELQADRSTPCGAEVKNAWSFITAPSIRLRGISTPFGTELVSTETRCLRQSPSEHCPAPRKTVPVLSKCSARSQVSRGTCSVPKSGRRALGSCDCSGGPQLSASVGQQHRVQS